MFIYQKNQLFFSLLPFHFIHDNGRTDYSRIFENIFSKTFYCQVSDWNTFNVTWTCVSAVSSMVSLGWGVAAYSQALRMVREDKGKLSWMGMVLQTVWRFSMLSARIVALVLISLTLHRWVFIVLGKNNLKRKVFLCFYKI